MSISGYHLDRKDQPGSCRIAEPDQELLERPRQHPHGQLEESQRQTVRTFRDRHQPNDG